MERLTKRISRPDKEADVIVFTKGQYEDTIAAEMTKNDIRQILRRLADYEDLGVTPEQIKEMDAMYREIAEKLGEYEKIGTLEDWRETWKDGKECVNYMFDMARMEIARANEEMEKE